MGGPRLPGWSRPCAGVASGSDSFESTKRGLRAVRFDRASEPAITAARRSLTTPELSNRDASCPGAVDVAAGARIGVRMAPLCARNVRTRQTRIGPPGLRWASSRPGPLSAACGGGCASATWPEMPAVRGHLRSRQPPRSPWLQSPGPVAVAVMVKHSPPPATRRGALGRGAIVPRHGHRDAADATVRPPAGGWTKAIPVLN